MSRKLVRLNDVAEINPRFRPEDMCGEVTVSFVPMAAVSEVSGAIVQEVEKPIADVIKGFTPFLNGDILIAKITPCFENGKIALAQLSRRVGFGSTEFHVVRPIANKLDARYVFHFLRQPRIRKDGEGRMTGSAGQRRVPKNYIEHLEISLPSLADQKRIAAILDEADALRRKRREALTKLDMLLQSLFLEMFGDPVTNPKGWKIARFDTLLGMPLRNGVSPSNVGKYQGKVLTLSAITRGLFDPRAVKEAFFAEPASAEKLVNISDFLICRGNGNLGMVGRAHFPTQVIPDTVFPDTMIAARIDVNRILPRYLEALWSMPDMRRQIEGAARTTNGTYKVNQGMMESIEVLLPPFPLQNVFALKSAEINVMRERCEVSLNRQETLFAALQHRAFTLSDTSSLTTITQPTDAQSCLTLDF